MLVAVLVDAPVLLGEVEGPVGVEAAVGDQCPEFQHGLGTGQRPAGPGDVEAVFQVAPGSFDDAGGDGPADGQCGVIAQPGSRSSAWSDAADPTSAMVSATDPVSHLLPALGPSARSRPGSAGASGSVMTSS